jgi:hypothetical protein
VTINAATAVNINQSITNLKTGSNLAITAGTDINVLAQVDGRSGTAAGGAVTMTAGNNINVTNVIATNNGAIALTATAGSVTLPVATETIQSVFDPVRNQFYDQIVLFPDGSSPMQASILAGNAPVTVTSGGNFMLTSPIKTTGALTITSTNGNVTTAAPIDDQTGGGHADRWQRPHRESRDQDQRPGDHAERRSWRHHHKPDRRPRLHADVIRESQECEPDPELDRRREHPR